MSSLESYGGSNRTSYQGSLSARDGRSMARSLGQLQASSAFGAAKIDSATEQFSEVMASVADLSRQAMMGVASVGQLEGQLGQIAPQARARLEYIADMHATQTGETLLGAGRALRRLVQ